MTCLVCLQEIDGEPAVPEVPYSDCHERCGDLQVKVFMVGPDGCNKCAFTDPEAALTEVSQLMSELFEGESIEIEMKLMTGRQVAAMGEFIGY